MIKLPDFATKKELLDFLVTNKETIVAQKKSIIKEADGICGYRDYTEEKKTANKSQDGSEMNVGEIKVRAIINTTNFLDSHKDVHIPGIWTKSLKENNRIMHIQEHMSGSFDKIIASGEDLKASAKTMSWKELGYDAIGTTQALVFDSVVKESRNAYMYQQYKQGFVNNHSVGMRYVKIELAINDKDYPTEKGFYDKYITEIINRKEAEASKYFWVVTEAKVIEGSAVPMGSNPITPTTRTKSEPSIIDLINQIDTQEKAADSTFSIISDIKKYNFNLNKH
tara:strand:- start:15267 stop:16109 length:843 start_codon:yes stop_codon:yes gene_type:complete